MKIVKDFFIVESGILFPKITVSFFPFKVDTIVTIIIVTGIILIPPVVEAGAPPININIIKTTLVSKLKASIFVIVKPVDLGVVAINKLLTIDKFGSNILIKIVGKTIIISETVRTILVCNLNLENFKLLLFLMSCITYIPIPPITIRHINIS